MGKSLNGKELGTGISQRKDGLYQARFIDRFGKRRTLYGKTLNEIRTKLRTEQYEDDKKINVVHNDIILDEWFDKWLDIYKRRCRDTTINNYKTCYKRIGKSLGWRKLSSLNLTILQEAFNKLSSDNARKDSKEVLVDMLSKALDTDLIVKNVATQINTTVSNDKKKERRVLTREETKCFLNYAQKKRNRYYYNIFALALETGMRIGELLGLSWSDVDLDKKVIYVRHTLVYFSKEGKCAFAEHDPKTDNSIREIPLTSNAIDILRKQRIEKQKVIFSGKSPMEGFEDLVFVTRNATPIKHNAVLRSIYSICKNIRQDNDSFELLSPHTFRHTFATRCIESGMNPKTLQKLLGHTTLKMTMDLYCHVTDDTLHTEMEKFEMFGT